MLENNICIANVIRTVVPWPFINLCWQKQVTSIYNLFTSANGDMLPVAHFGATGLSHELQITIFVLKQRLSVFVLRGENSMWKKKTQTKTQAPQTQTTTPTKVLFIMSNARNFD